MKFVVTIARQLGCGGSEIGHDLADALGIRCIDREIISETARRFDLQEQEIALREERVLPFWERMLTGFVVAAPEAAYVPAPSLMPSDTEVFQAETEVLKSIAARQSCVIVGRAATHILPPSPHKISILLHAPLDFRVARVMEYLNSSDSDLALAKIERSDSMRARSIAQMTGQDGMNPENYHLCLDSSALPLPQIVGLLTDFVAQKTALS